jgi:hypothetical protein
MTTGKAIAGDDASNSAFAHATTNYSAVIGINGNRCQSKT